MFIISGRALMPRESTNVSINRERRRGSLMRPGVVNCKHRILYYYTAQERGKNRIGHLVTTPPLCEQDTAGVCNNYIVYSLTRVQLLYSTYYCNKRDPLDYYVAYTSWSRIFFIKK